MLNEEHERAFEELFEAMLTGSGLDDVTLYLVSLAAALALGCPTCIQYFTAQAKSAGVDQQRLEGVAAAAMAVAAGGVRNRYLENCE